MTTSVSTLKAFRSSFLDFVDDPFYATETESVRYIPDGLLVIEGDRIKEHSLWVLKKHVEWVFTDFP